MIRINPQFSEISKIAPKHRHFCCTTGSEENGSSSCCGTYTKHGPGSMDHLMDLVHGPPHGPGPWTTPWTWSWTRSMDQVPWTTPNFQKGNRPCQFYMKIYRRSGYEKRRLLFIAYILEGLSRKSVLFWDRGPMNGKTTNSF